MGEYATYSVRGRSGQLLATGARALGGELEVRSAPGKGTTILGQLKAQDS